MAIGEIGLDFHYDHSPRDVQREVFRRQLRLAREVGLPVIIHTREADDETVAILEHEEAEEIGGVIHCFTGARELARAGAGAGLLHLLLGHRGLPAGRGRSRRWRARCPRERLLVETDAPFLAPPPHRGKRNEPAFVVEVARAVAAPPRASASRTSAVAATRRTSRAPFKLAGAFDNAGANPSP